MEIKLARSEINSEPKIVDIEELKEKVEKLNGEIFYFDRENSHKDLVTLVEYFENLNRTVYFREIKYGFDEDEYLYEVHIL